MEEKCKIILSFCKIIFLILEVHTIDKSGLEKVRVKV